MAKAIVFLGTPHRGADAATWANFVALAFRALQMGTSTNSLRSLHSDLRKDSEILRQISQQFVERGSTLRMKTFYETNKSDYMNCLVYYLENGLLE